MIPKQINLFSTKQAFIERLRVKGMLAGVQRPSPVPEQKPEPAQRPLTQAEIDARDLEAWDRGLDEIADSLILKKGSTTPKK
mgnify:CR=1 FL=1